MIGSLGFWEIAFILMLALLIFGPKRLPELGKTLGRGVREFRRATSDLKRSIEQEIDLDDDGPSYERPRLENRSSGSSSPSSTPSSSPSSTPSSTPSSSPSD